MTKRINFVIISSLLLLSAIFTEAQNVQFENSLFWEISGNGLKQPSFIFGTLHLIPKSDFFMPQIVIKKLKSCKTFALEIDLDVPMTKQFELAQLAILPDDSRISDYMDSASYEQFAHFYIDSIGIKKKQFEKLMRFKPYFSTALFTQKMLGKTKIYDKYFFNKAKKLKLQIVPLETIDFQISVLEQIPIDIQCKAFFGSQNPRKDYNEMLINYEKQDINEMANLENDTLLSSYQNILLEKRNKTWIPKIEKLITENSTFIAVGAGHLAGQKGVLNYLIQKGYKIEPIFIK